METYRDLIAFLQNSSDSKFMKFHTARTRKTAIRRIFQDSSFENASIFEVYIGDVIKEFKSKKNDISDETIETYKSRFQSALKDFIRYEKLGEKMTIVEGAGADQRGREVNYKSESIDLPCPIRKGEHIIHINNLPIDLKPEELARLSSLIKDFIDIEE